jgi:uncharacterized protein with ParB-like and HNH nuclease domain
MSRIENHRYTIEEAFKECFYVVPDYQREYIWQEKEVLQLLEDIDEQIGSTSEYFIGTILVSPTDIRNHYEVIDGQQRLTTFFLLLCALRHIFTGDISSTAITGLISTSYTTREGNTETTLKLDPRYENASDLMQKIVDLNAAPETTRTGVLSSGIGSFGSLENLLNAYSTIYRFLENNYDELAERKKYWGYLATSVVFIQISTDVGSALKIFETINERGIGLNPMDLLKNLLFKQVHPAEFTALKNEWKKITAPLEKRKEKPLRFLRYFLMANYRIKIDRKDSNDSNSGIVREDEIYDWLTDKANAALCGYQSKPFDFVRKISKNVELYVDYAQDRANDGTASIPMQNLKLLTGGAFSQHYVLLLAAASFERALFDHLVTQLECFLFYYIFTKTPTKDLERLFSQWADELREIGAIPNLQEQKNELNIFVANRFQKNMDAKDAELTDTLNRFTISSMQKYRIHYLLSKLTQHVELSYKGLKGPHPLNVYQGIEIEHILPNTPDQSLETAFIVQNPGKDYSIYKNKLGNLMLLEKPINIVASNNFYDLKKPEYKKSTYYLTRSIVQLIQVGNNSSVNRINNMLEAFPDWDADSIDRRQELLSRLSKEVWKTIDMQ